MIFTATNVFCLVIGPEFLGMLIISLNFFGERDICLFFAKILSRFMNIELALSTLEK